MGQKKNKFNPERATQLGSPTKGCASPQKNVKNTANEVKIKVKVKNRFVDGVT